MTWIGSLMGSFKHTSTWFRYAYALHRAITIFTTAGYRNLQAKNTGEICFSIFFMLFDIALSAYLIGKMINLIVHSAFCAFIMRDAINEILRYVSKNQLPENLKRQIMAHIQCRYNMVEWQQDELFKNLPKTIRSRIAHHLFEKTIKQSYLFKGVSEDLIVQLISKTKAEYFLPKVDIIKQNEISTDFYILVSGKLDLVTYKDGREQFLLELGPADMAGEMGILFNTPQSFTVRSRCLTQVIRISHQHFKQVVLPRDQDGRTIISNFVQYLKELKGEILEEIPGYLYNEPIISNKGIKNHKVSTLGAPEGLDNFEGSPQKPTSTCLPIRLIIHGHHPDEANTLESNKLGKLINLPKTIEELLQLAGDHPIGLIPINSPFKEEFAHELKLDRLKAPRRKTDSASTSICGIWTGEEPSSG